MRFCPKCGNRLKGINESGKVVMKCNKCGYTEEGVEKKSEVIKSEGSTIKIISEDKEEVLPTIKIECPKCKHDTAVWWMLQTRSADEPTTQFYRCVKCNYTWRHYA